jgi:putative FmdB family regulatory protein
MPTYTYFCEEEHGEFEVEHSIKEKLEDCPKCIEEGIDPPHKVIRLISSGGTFILLGDCWGKTGYS